MISSEYIHLFFFFLLFVFFLNPLINVRADQLLVVQNSVNRFLVNLEANT